MPSSAHAILLAGGEGTRLRPLTSAMPKALIPVGGQPILDILLRQLHRQGFSDLTLTVGYLAEMIDAHVARVAPRLPDARLRIIREATPLGTAGCLALLPALDQTTLVINADILTTLDFGQLYDGHRASGAILTVAACERVSRVKWGVLDATESGELVSYREKPEYAMCISMGVYVCEPDVRRHVAPDERVDMPVLIERLLADKLPVRIHRSRDYWLDLGHPQDYARACEDFEARRDQFGLGDA
jgi:NDP-sugar pyrophosphorylase family protein